MNSFDAHISPDPIAPALPLNTGEAPVDHAPHVRLRGGMSCIPQHYLRYNHTRESVENIVMQIEYDPDYLVFVSENTGGVYIQIGVAGWDNYKPASAQPGRKIVFGRLWRVEPDLPTSEIIQTVFLALQKAREHEVRELFTVCANGIKTTPLSNHHDLPLMARCADTLKAERTERRYSDIIDAVRFAGGRFKTLACEPRANGTHIIDLAFTPAPGRPCPQLEKPFTLLTEDLSENAVYHALMDEILRRNNLHVARNFRFKGFARFSPDVSLSAIAELSATVRARPQNAKFETALTDNNYETDAGRVPQLSRSAYAQKLKADIARLDIRAGFLPS